MDKFRSAKIAKACFKKDAFMTHLSLKEVMTLLDIDTVNGTPKEVERLRKWIEILAEKRGNVFVMENRQSLLDQWDEYMKRKTDSCCL